MQKCNLISNQLKKCLDMFIPQKRDLKWLELTIFSTHYIKLALTCHFGKFLTFSLMSTLLLETKKNQTDIM